MSDYDFYRAFEERYRGSRDLILSRLKVYLPFIQILKTLEAKPNAIDLGCGRGEWLEFLKLQDCAALGVDQNLKMLQSCFDRNLEVIEGDAIDLISCLPDESYSIVSAFHMVEHIEFEKIQEIVSHALRVLKPGGLLIMETPNPENLVVGTSSFYLDPTHDRPLPPLLLSFLPEYYGFKRVKTLRLQESIDVLKKTSTTLIDVLEGVSPDYAVIAQKNASLNYLAAFDDVFNRQYGLVLSDLAGSYDVSLRHEINRARDEAFTSASSALEMLVETKKNVDSVAQSVEKVYKFEEQALEILNKLQAIENSFSWRVTKPIRYFEYQFLAIKRIFIKVVKNSLLALISYVNRHPKVKRRLILVFKKTRIDAFVRRFYYAHGFYKVQQSAANSGIKDAKDMTPYAQGIYRKLKTRTNRRTK